MRVRYYLDEDTGVAHIRAHGVLESEVEDVLRRPIENRPGRSASRVIIGRTRAGRVLRVICVPDDADDGMFVVTAFELTGKPLRAFQRRCRKRGKP